MNDLDWMDAQTACAVLGVKPQTLYSYVSRGKLRARTLPSDGRQSLYSRHDVDLLAQQKRRPRARAEIAQASIRWGEPILKTSISGAKDGCFWLRGHRIETCADTYGIEDVAGLLCGLQGITIGPAEPIGQGKTCFTRAMDALLEEANSGRFMLDDTTCLSAQDVGDLLGTVTAAVLQAPGKGPVHEWIARAWGLQAVEADIVRRCLVLLSDHELNPSAFAVRVCASTRTSLPAALLAGMATLSGSLHGSASSNAYQALVAAEEGRMTEFRETYSETDPYFYGFGHPLYPNGDPRAAYLLAHLPSDSSVIRAIGCWREFLGIHPNIDLGLSAIVRHFQLPPHSAEAIFCIARAVGWIAHAIEQVSSGSVIRPRALFEMQTE